MRVRQSNGLDGLREAHLRLANSFAKILPSRTPIVRYNSHVLLRQLL